MNDELHTTPPPENKTTRTERRIKSASDALRTLLRDIYAYKFGAVGPPQEELNLMLRLTARPHENWDLRFDPPILDQVSEQMEDAQAGRAVYQDGRVHCFRCSSSTCEHAEPSLPLCVFAGYDSTGRPEWHELAQVFVEMKDERVDMLFARSPRILTLVQLGRELRGEQLSAFGRSSKSYAVLGQVVAGYFAVPSPPGEPPARVAISFQIVEARDQQGHFKLHLNSIARLPDGSPLDDKFGEGWQPAVLRARTLAARALEALELRVRAARENGRTEEARADMRQVPQILRRLSENIERGERQSQRRTRHVEDRRREQRPVKKAVEDARMVTPESLFYDIKARTFVVTGPKGRAHAFTQDGRHVTSFTIRPAAVGFRLRTERWRRLEADEAAAFKTMLKSTEAKINATTDEHE